MRKSYLLLALLICANTICFAEEVENKEKTDNTANKTEITEAKDAESDSSKIATTEASETKEADVKADEKKESDTEDKEKSDSKDTKDTKTTVATDKTNPFSDESVTVTAEAEPTKIADVDTAKAAGIEKIADGYPKSGVLDALGGDRLRLRSWPWGNVIGNYYAGTSVEILGESGEFYLVNINGTQGYMHKNYISTSDKAASGVSPYYPGDTSSGGALSLEEGIKASKDGAEGKVPTVASSDSSSGSDAGSSSSTPGTVTKNGKYVCMEIQKLCQMTTNTPAPGSACGPTSVSMVLSYYGKGDAAKIVSNVYKISGCTAANGTGHDGLAKAAKSYGLNATWHYSSTQAWCREQLEAGKPLVCHVNHHYVVMKGMDANGNVIINDPGKSVVERTMSWSEFAAWWNKSNAPMSCMVCN